MPSHRAPQLTFITIGTVVVIAVGIALFAGGNARTASTAAGSVHRIGGGPARGASHPPARRPRMRLALDIRGHGTVRARGRRCASDCELVLARGKPVALAPTADPGWTFAGWAGYCDGADLCRVDTVLRHAVTARFVPVPLQPVALHIHHDGTGAGVVSIAGGLRCSGDCATEVPPGRALTLTADATGGARFDRLTEPAACATTTACSVQVTADMTVAAHFSAVPAQPTRFTLIVKAIGPGSVDLCNGRRSCSRTYNAGTRLVATPRPASRGTFAGWEGCTAWSGASCRLAMSDDRSITAQFLRTFALTTSIAGDPAARLKVEGRGSCAHGCAFARSAEAKLRVVHAPDSTVRWTGAACTGDTCKVRMRRDRTVHATIVHPPRTLTWSTCDTDDCSLHKHTDAPVIAPLQVGPRSPDGAPS